jgi:hypothetical protein
MTTHPAITQTGTITVHLMLKNREGVLTVKRFQERGVTRGGDLTNGITASRRRSH